MRDNDQSKIGQQATLKVRAFFAYIKHASGISNDSPNDGKSKNMLKSQKEEKGKEDENLTEDMKKLNGCIFIDKYITVFEIAKGNACIRIERYNIRAVSDGVREMKLSILKSSAYPGIKFTRIRGGEMTETDKSDHILYTIRFPKELRKDEKHEIVVRWDVSDLTHAPWCQVGLSTFAGFGYLQFLMIFPDDHLGNIRSSYTPKSTGVETKPKQLVPEVFPSFPCDHVQDKQFIDLKIDATESSDYPTNKDYRYKIGWNFVKA